MDTDVLIVGAGPVGLMLACELQRRQVRYRLIEAKTERVFFCKALGVSPRTLEIFDCMGLLEEAVNRGLWFTATNTIVNGEVVARVPIQTEKWAYGPISIPQYGSEELLEGFLQEHGGRVEYGVSLVGMQPAPGGTQCDLGSAGVVTARYVVGTDGAHSGVRKSLGIDFPGGRYGQVFLLGDVDLQGWNHPHSEVCKVMHTVDGAIRNVCAVVPVPGDPHRYRLSMAAPPIYWEEGAQLPEHPSLELVRECAGEILGPEVTISNLRWSSMYGISHRLAERYSEGAVFLAGDAAHIHPPIGGLGMNTGLQDAFNLGWKLARVVRGGAPESLLATYGEERHRVGEEVVALTARRMDDALEAKQTDAEREAAEEAANTQFNVSYAGGSLAGGAGDTGPAPGDRVPCIGGLTRPHVRREASFIDLLRAGRFVMVSYGGADLGAVARQALGDWVRCYRLGEEILDSRGEFAATFGPGPGAVLVRPDGHVGWRGTSGDELVRYLALV